MNRQALIDMTRHIIARVKSESVDQEDQILKMPASAYTDPVRWEAERTKIFGALPIVVALSCELKEPGDYRSVDLMKRPVLVVRQKDGTAQAFVNMCSHRGARVVSEGNGRAGRFTCSYHGWTYDSTGKLIAIAGAREFGEIDRSCYSLTRLRTYERSGFIWAILDAKSTLGFEAFLAGYDHVIEAFGVANWHVFGRKQLSSVNWKLTYDGYVDFYHLPVLHRATFKNKFSNQALNFRWGPHQRISTPDTSLLKLEERPESEWDVKAMLKGVWPMFPNGAMISIDGRGTAIMFSQIFPGDSVIESYSTHTFLTEHELTTNEERAAAEKQFSFLVDVLRDEDYVAAAGVQANLLVGTRDHVLFGRNEPGGHHFHGWVDDIVNAKDDKELRNVFARGHNSLFVGGTPAMALAVGGQSAR